MIDQQVHYVRLMVKQLGLLLTLLAPWTLAETHKCVLGNCFNGYGAKASDSGRLKAGLFADGKLQGYGITRTTNEVCERGFNADSTHGISYCTALIDTKWQKANTSTLRYLDPQTGRDMELRFDKTGKVLRVGIHDRRDKKNVFIADTVDIEGMLLQLERLQKQRNEILTAAYLPTQMHNNAALLLAAASLAPPKPAQPPKAPVTKKTQKPAEPNKNNTTLKKKKPEKTASKKITTSRSLAAWIHSSVDMGDGLKVLAAEVDDYADTINIYLESTAVVRQKGDSELRSQVSSPLCANRSNISITSDRPRLRLIFLNEDHYEEFVLEAALFDCQ